MGRPGSVTQALGSIPAALAGMPSLGIWLKAYDDAALAA
jgi:hypothetical protein